jgi:hypothetical protein
MVNITKTRVKQKEYTFDLSNSALPLVVLD